MKVGDTVPYRNSHGKICMAEVTELVPISADKFWFRGLDVNTKANVWYSCSISKKLTVPGTDTGTQDAAAHT